MMRAVDSNSTVTQPTDERMNTMNAQPEGNSHDTEISDMAEEMSGIMQAAFDLLIQRRDGRYAAAIEPLETERDTLEQESAAIALARRNLELLLPAREREARRQADVLLLAGKDSEAQVKLTEAAEAAHAPAAMADRQSKITARIEVIEREKKAIARRVFESWYPDAQRVIRAAEHGLFVTLLDGVESSMTEYEARTGTGGTLVKLAHITGLTAGERSLEWTAGNRWYGGRVR